MQDISTGFQDVDQFEAGFLMKFLEIVSAQPSVSDCFQLQLEMLDISDNDHVLDMGCGIGDHAAQMANQLGSDGRIVATDLSRKMIDICRERHSGMQNPPEYLQADAARHPFSDESFDKIRIERVLSYIREPEVVFKESKRLLKSGGKLLLSDFDWNSLSINHPNETLTNEIIEYVSDSFPNGGIAVELENYLISFGFKAIRSRPTAYSGEIESARMAIGGILNSAVQLGRFDKEEVSGWWSEGEANNFIEYQGLVIMGSK